MNPEVTPIPPQLEAQFREWIKRNQIGDLDHPSSRYDYRGAFMAGVGSEVSNVDGLPHWPDTFKQHGHPTFSIESQYSQGPNDGGRWEGETYIPQMTDPKLKPQAASRDATGNIKIKGPPARSTTHLPYTDPAANAERMRLRKLGGDGEGGEYSREQYDLDNAGDVEGLRRSQKPKKKKTFDEQLHDIFKTPF